MATTREGRPHVVVMPMPIRGHVNPMLLLSKLLAAHGVTITFVNSEFDAAVVARLESSSRPAHASATLDIRFEQLPDGLPPHLDRSTHVLDLCETLVRSMAAPFEDLLRRLLLHSDPPPSCVLADTWMTFTVEAANKFGLPHANVWTQSAASFTSLLMIANGSYTPSAHGEPHIPGAEFLREADMNSFARCYDRSDYMFRFVTGGLDRLSDSRWIFLNTFDELERKTLEALKQDNQHFLTALHAIGPLLPPSFLSQQESYGHKAQASNEASEDDEEPCLTWLNKFEVKSVLYVAFGTLALISTEQIEEIALGLEASGHPFLWVVRPDLIYAQSPTLQKDYLDRVRDRAYFVSWSPQLKVLSHKAIGGFFTHAGWNSTLESISAGVPMLCWPFFSDQPMDCKLIERGWYVGLRLQEQEDTHMKGLVPHTMVESKVRVLMSSDAFHVKSQQWSSIAKKAALPGGSSFNNILHFVEFLKALP